MLTDIFAYRYAQTPIWENFGEVERRLLVQAFQIVSEQLYPYRAGKAIILGNQEKWNSIRDKLCRELGLEALSSKTWGYWTKFQGEDFWSSGEYSIEDVCKNYVSAPYDGSVPADRWMKERISFIELAFREREEEIKIINAGLPKRLAEAASMDARRVVHTGVPNLMTNAEKAQNEALHSGFKAAVQELNERLRRSGCKLHYHNGFVQQSTDTLASKQIEEPFWALLTDAIWKNVDYDMKDAIDKRDNGDRDPAFYAAKALESTIKIVSDMKRWTTGKEAGASHYIDNLFRGNLLKEWERDALRHFFRHVRNPMGHGPGSAEMPELSVQQTDCWAIEVLHVMD